MSIAHHYEGIGIHFLNLQLHCGDFFVRNHQEEHFFVVVAVETATLDACSRAVERLEDELAEIFVGLVRHDEDEFVVLCTIDHIGDGFSRNKDGNERVEGEMP